MTDGIRLLKPHSLTHVHIHIVSKKGSHEAEAASLVQQAREQFRFRALDPVGLAQCQSVEHPLHLLLRREDDRETLYGSRQDSAPHNSRLCSNNLNAYKYPYEIYM